MTENLGRDANAIAQSQDAWFKRAEEASGFREGLIDGAVEWEIGSVPFAPNRYFDEYHRGSAELHLHFGWLHGRTNHQGTGWQLPADYCVVLRKVAMESEVATNTGLNPANGETGRDSANATAYGSKLTVLVSVIDSADEAQDRAVSISSQVIGLRPYDDCLSSFVDSANASLKIFSGLGQIDHEFSISADPPQIDPSERKPRDIGLVGLTDGCANNVVECASEVMYEVTQHEGEVRIRLLGDAYSVPNIQLTIRLRDTRECVGIEASVVPGISLDVYAVLLSTFEFEPPGRGHEVDSDYERQPAGPTDTRDAEGPDYTASQAEGHLPRSKKVAKIPDSGDNPDRPKK